MDSNSLKVIKSVKLSISNQIVHYLSVKDICRSSYTYFSIFGELGQVGEIGPKFPLPIHRKSFIVLNSTFHIKWSPTYCKCECHLRVNIAQIPHIINTDTQEVIQSVKLHISHQVKPYSNVETIWGLIYTCFSIFWALEQVRESRPKKPKSWALDI